VTSAHGWGLSRRPARAPPKARGGSALWTAAAVALCAAPGVFVPARAARAQETQPFDPANYEFLERQYIFWSPQKIVTNGVANPLGFEAQVGPHVPLVGTALDHREPIEATHWELRLLFTFQSNLRLTAGDSTPVLTPSYRPQFRLQLLGNRVHGAPTPNNHPTSYRWGLTADLWSHHSNGQDGCTFRGTPPAGRDCPEIGGGATALNERTGSFSTDYTGLTLDGRYSWGTRPHSRALSLIGMLGGQFHHNFPGAGLDDTPTGDLRRLWGRWHGLAEVELNWNIANQEEAWAGVLYGRYRLELASGGADARLPGVTARHDAHVAEVGWICTRLHGLGFFARVVAGREYYNIEFTQSPTRLQFGVVIDSNGNVPPILTKVGR